MGFTPLAGLAMGTRSGDIDPAIITGWNSDLFDYPYLFFRTCKLFGQEAANKMITKLGHVTQKNDIISIPEYSPDQVPGLLQLQ